MRQTVLCIGANFVRHFPKSNLKKDAYRESTSHTKMTEVSLELGPSVLGKKHPELWFSSFSMRTMLWFMFNQRGYAVDRECFY